MYAIHPPAVYIHERVLSIPDARQRLDRMLTHVHCQQDPQIVDDAALHEISLVQGWPAVHERRTGQWKLAGDPFLVFNVFTWEDPTALHKRTAAYPGLRTCMFHGGGAWTFRDGRGYYAKRGTVCQNAFEIHSAWGCLHRCDYCHVGNFLNMMLNLEELTDRLPGLLESAPGQQLFKYDNQTDTICFEPEYGASELLVDFFAHTPDKFLMLYTKSDNVDHLLPLDHRGHTIVSFTISSESAALEIEKNTPDMRQRIAAAAKIQSAGYMPRVRFSPIVPVKNWREEATELVHSLLKSVSPDVISIDVLGWMNPECIGEILDTSLLDASFLNSMHELFADGPPGPAYYPSSKHIFPHDLRKAVYLHYIDEIRSHDQAIRIALCNETVEMWKDIGHLLDMTPEKYVCGCGPTSVPGNPLFPTQRDGKTAL